MGLSPLAAGTHVPYYWGGAMVGRFIGSWFLKRFSPGKVLAFNASTAILLLILSASLDGPVSGWALLAIGLFNSIMFPTIFSLASEGLGVRAAEGSGIICMAIVGGAIVPLFTGEAADLAGLKLALAVPMTLLCRNIGFRHLRAPPDGLGRAASDAATARKSSRSANAPVRPCRRRKGPARRPRRIASALPPLAPHSQALRPISNADGPSGARIFPLRRTSPRRGRSGSVSSALHPSLPADRRYAGLSGWRG